MGRIKDEHKHHQDCLGEISPRMRAFVDELEVMFPKLRYTSGKRSPSDKVGKFSDESKHNTGNAVDIGAEHTDVYYKLMNTKEGIELMRKHGVGIMDETDPKIQANTGATGPHFHIGIDPGLVANTNNRYNILSKGEELPESIAYGARQKKPVSSPLSEVRRDFVLPLNIDRGQDYGTGTTTAGKMDDELYRIQQKEAEKEKMIAEDEDTAELTEEQNLRNILAKNLTTPNTVVDYYDEEPSPDFGISVSEIELPEHIDSLPTMPQIFTL